MIIRFQSHLILGYLVGFIAFFAPILGFIASKGLAPLVIIGSICCVIILRVQARKIIWLGLPVFLILSCFCLWALLSSLWSADPVASSIGSVRLFGNILAGLLLFVTIRNLSKEEKNLTLKFLLTGFLIVICIVVLEILLGGPIFIALKNQYISIERVWQGQNSGIFWLNPVMVVLSLFIWPISVGLYKKIFSFSLKKFPVLSMVFGFSMILILSITISFFSGVLAILCGLLGATIISIFGRWVAIAAVLVIAVVSFSLPFGFYVSQNPISQINSLIHLPTSAVHRIGIWKFTSDKVIEHPLVGWGMNASKSIPGGKSFLFFEDGTQLGSALPLHPHNVILQIWLELGLPGIVLFLALCIFIIMTSVNRLKLKFESAMIFGQFITILGISNVSFGMWQAWWISTIWLSVSFMLLVISSDKGK